MKAPRSAPEAKLQMNVRRFLMVALAPSHVPGSIIWTASLAGVNLSMQARTKMKAMGVTRGWPDLQFLFPDGVTRYIELKAGAALSSEQREFLTRTAPHGIACVCRSVEEVEAALRAWGAPLRATTGRLAA